MKKESHLLKYYCCLWYSKTAERHAVCVACCMIWPLEEEKYRNKALVTLTVFFLLPLSYTSFLSNRLFLIFKNLMSIFILGTPCAHWLKQTYSPNVRPLDDAWKQCVPWTQAGPCQPRALGPSYKPQPTIQLSPQSLNLL